MDDLNPDVVTALMGTGAGALVGAAITSKYYEEYTDERTANEKVLNSQKWKLTNNSFDDSATDAHPDDSSSVWV